MSQIPFSRTIRRVGETLKVAFKKMVANGEIPIVIGARTLIERPLSFKYFAYAIIDEQHRFRHHAPAETRN